MLCQVHGAAAAAAGRLVPAPSEPSLQLVLCSTLVNLNVAASSPHNADLLPASSSPPSPAFLHTARSAA
eukprot:749581-Hanusia_phi.AAC.1